MIVGVSGFDKYVQVTTAYRGSTTAHPSFSHSRRGSGLAEDLHLPVKRVREDNGLDTPASVSASVVTSVRGTVYARSPGTCTPPVSAPSPSSAVFYERGEREQREIEREREREREHVRGEYGMGYDRDEHGRRSPPLLGST